MGSYSLPLYAFMPLPGGAFGLERGAGADPEALRTLRVVGDCLACGGAAMPRSEAGTLSDDSLLSLESVVVVVVLGVVVVVLGVVVSVSAAAAVCGFSVVLIWVTACGVPNPGAPNADSSFSYADFWPADSAIGRSRSLRYSVTTRPAAIATPISTLPKLPPPRWPRNAGMSLIVIGRRLSGERKSGLGMTGAMGALATGASAVAASAGGAIVGFRTDAGAWTTGGYAEA